MAYETRELTHEEAAAWPEDAEHFPTPWITLEGEAAIAAWISKFARFPENHTLDAWLADAEISAAEVGPLVSPSIELRGISSKDGCPHVLTMDSKEHFAWSVQVAQP